MAEKWIEDAASEIEDLIGITRLSPAEFAAIIQRHYEAAHVCPECKGDPQFRGTCWRDGKFVCWSCGGKGRIVP